MSTSIGISTIRDFNRPDDERVQEMVWVPVQAQEELHQLLLMAAERRRPRASETTFTMGMFREGDHVLIARPPKVTKVMAAWTGPWKAVLYGKHVHMVDAGVSG